jgi:hypothetical protein
VFSSQFRQHQKREDTQNCNFIFLPVVLYGCETWSPKLSKEQRFRVRSEVLTVMKMSMLWVVASCRLVSRYQRFEENIFSPEDEDSMFLRNVGIYLQIYKVSQLRRTTSTLTEVV